jgi:peptidoglycan/LPS O-acetylase OafA/YrhL
LRQVSRNLTLDCLRIFACLWVWTYHWTGHAATWKEFPGNLDLEFSFIPKLVDGFFARGFLGVQIFFAISGWVIAQTAVLTNPSKFLKHRFLRLYPSYLIASIITIIFYNLAGGSRTFTSGLIWLTGFPLLTQNRPFIGPAWSLHFEILFYLAVFLLLLKGNINSNLKVLANLISIAFFFVLLIGKITQQNLINSYILYLPFFVFGIFLRILNTRTALKRNLIGFIMSCLVLIFDLRYFLDSYTYAIFIFFTICIPFSLARVEIAQNWAINFRVAINIKRFSLMTYPIYLLHLTAGGALISYLSRKSFSIGLSISIATVLVLTLSYWIVEKCEPKFTSYFR